MRFDYNDQIPEGLMDRVEQRLAAHLAVKKKKRVKKTLILLSMCLLLIPATVYGVVSNNFNSWFDAIRMAHNKGKTVKLNSVFEYEGNRIVFEDAVWEEDNLMVSYRIVDGEFWPSQFMLKNEKGEIINHQAAAEHNGKDGTLKVHFDEEQLSGEKAFFSIKSIEKLKYPNDNIEFKHKLSINKDFLTTGHAVINKTFEAEHGLITIEEINIKDGMTFLTYKCDWNDKILSLAEQDWTRMPMLAFYIKDAENNIIEGYSHYNGEHSKIGKCGLSGVIKNLDKPIELAVEFNEKLVDWEIPIEVKKFSSEVVEINKDVVMDSGTIRISEMILKSASTYLKYEFIPGKGYENTEGIRPLIEIVFGGKKYACSEYLQEMSGKMVFPVGIDKKDLKKVKLNVLGIYRYEVRDEKFTLAKEAAPTYFVVDGVKFNVERMEVKDGKTCIDILVDGANRKFTDLDVSYSVEEGEVVSKSVKGGLEFTDKSVEKKLEKDPYSFEVSDLEKTIIRKNLEIEKELNTVELKLVRFEYLELSRTEIKIK
ncbi:hypothetical protein [Acetivibrio clariflavus]|uniref:DUF4179 domain-containing protein n=1 Tax=Acetivibrio clariflavus (strain DSM 19732 / NBRC 101661 / EBR45) TaxID=720554 RepID=G8LXQ8_ACECE|nr:hypothetical protein [Acetivibrio clariflavus]AEV68811.1 hypothetical protein Clocl_2219 [Acetivibrio clariflavus DSM 19732]